MCHDYWLLHWPVWVIGHNFDNSWIHDRVINLIRLIYDSIWQIHDEKMWGTLRSRILWYRLGEALGSKVAKLSARFSGRLPMTFSSASAFAISLITYPENEGDTASAAWPARPGHGSERIADFHGIQFGARRCHCLQSHLPATQIYVEHSHITVIPFSLIAKSP